MSKKPAVRICADCQHCTVQRQLLVLTVERCAHPRAVDVVTGKAVWDARQLRTPGSRLCGPGGRLWAAKAPPATPIDILTIVEPLAPRRAKA